MAYRDSDATVVTPLRLIRRRTNVDTPVATDAASDADSSGSALVAANKRCWGCRRIPGISYCFHQTEELLKWWGEKGSWCVGCFCCHRTCHGETIPISLFGKWLDDRSNFELWSLELAAFYSLKEDGCQNIHYAMIVTRMEGFKYTSRFLGTPSFQYAVVPLADVQNPTSRYNSTVVSASALVPLMGPDGSSRAAVLVPFPREHASYVELTSLTRD